MSPSNPVVTDRGHSPRELRWSYVRGGTWHECLLRLDANDQVYEFHVSDLDGRRRARRHTFSDAADAFEWHSWHEAALLRSGFSLEAFDGASRKS